MQSISSPHTANQQRPAVSLLAPRTRPAAVVLTVGWASWGVGIYATLGGGGDLAVLVALLSGFGLALTAYGLHPDRDWS